MTASLHTQRLRRYKDIVWLLMKYGRGDLAGDADLEGDLDGKPPGDGHGPSRAKDLPADLERMGPTFIKIGQLLSTRADLLPPAYLESLSRLQDSVNPFSYGQVEQIISSELGVRISKAFSEFDAAPLAAASLGQVHRAALRDGRRVAVKVQRPEIREGIAADFQALDRVAGLLERYTKIGKRYLPRKVVEEFRRTLLRELDYRQEARHLVLLADNLEGFDRIVIPRPIQDFTTTRVLTMDYLPGTKITAVSPLEQMELDGSALAEQLFSAYLKQVLVDGFFHADPHPGNVILTSDRKIALLDLGMVAWVTPNMQEDLLQLLLAVSEGRGDDAATLTLKIGETTEASDEKELRRRVGDLVARCKDATMERIQMGRIILDLSRTSGACGIRVPSELALLGKTLLNLDLVGKTLDPQFDPNASIRRNAAEILQRRMAKAMSLGNVFSSLLEAKDFAERLPSRVNKILDAVANNDLKVTVRAIDEVKLIAGLQKIANRITVGLVLAAMIVGAAMLMKVETSFQILGYPGLAMLLFLAAMAGGIILALSVLFGDESNG